MEPQDFAAILTPGSIKPVMSNLGASSRDLWQVRVEDINVYPDFNVRVHGPVYQERVRTYADSMKANGFYQDKPLAAFISEGKLYLADGHTRLDAAKLAISEGAPIVSLPVVVRPMGTSLEDLTVSLVTTNSGNPLDTYETAVVCKRLQNYGWNPEQIAKRVSISRTHVDNLLFLIGCPGEILEYVRDGRLAASMAIDLVKKLGPDAVQRARELVGAAQAEGRKKVTKRDDPEKDFKQRLRKFAPKLYENIKLAITNPKTAKAFDPEVLETLKELVEEIAEFEV